MRMTGDNDLLPIPILYGPTATGKSARALEMAREKPCVIINADAMQCYDALPVLTAQPSTQDRGQAPHKLYGIIPPERDMTVIDWLKLAEQEIREALKRRQQPILVGGTGFYIKALMQGLSPVPDIPSDIRARAEEIHQRDGLEPLIDDLAAYDPGVIEAIDVQNPRRVIRAWEVLEHTGQSLQEWQADQPAEPPCPDLSFELVPIIRPRPELNQRIDNRFDEMMEKGAMDEVQKLQQCVEAGEVPETALILKAHGYRPLSAALRGDISRAEAVARTRTETKQYAKRQMTWLRSQFDVDISNV